MKIDLPAAFPRADYVPHGYLDNPAHSMVASRSGVIRSVPPMGFGYWCRRMPWAYGDGTRRNVNYLSFLHPSITIEGTTFHLPEDFEAHAIDLVSRYHTKNAMTYDWQFEGVRVRLCYFLQAENTLLCDVRLDNEDLQGKAVRLDASMVYGYMETQWWGSDGVAARRGKGDTAVAKIWAYGDVFLLRTNLESVYWATDSREEWTRRIRAGEIEPNAGASSRWPNPVYSTVSSEFDLASGESKSVLVSLTRATNETYADVRDESIRATAENTLKMALGEDRRFYENAPILEGDWPDDWRRGWIYDLETIRMNVRNPLGIFKHHWDGMQIFSPRAVLGETVLDAMCLSYADVDLAKEIILGVFQDAPMPNVPCVREDGSMNMISMGGEECGTAPIWVLPFRILRAIYDRDRDSRWIDSLYLQLEDFVQWWLDNRTDKTGRFFCNNSWESGQDGSQRFLLDPGDEGRESEYVQTVDVEAAMADAMSTLAYLAPSKERAGYWTDRALKAIERTRAMFVDGWFRDFDARTGRPIMLPDYLDVMMLLPISVGIATPEQIEAIRPKFQHFLDHPRHWLEWPSFMFCYTEAGWNAGLRQDMADLVASTADRVYARTNGKPVKAARHPAEMPDPYGYRIPGTANEYWPMDADLSGCGSEAYGWGATLPTLIIRNIIGFREGADSYFLEPYIPQSLRKPGSIYSIRNLKWRGIRLDVRIEIGAEGSVKVTTSANSAR